MATFHVQWDKDNDDVTKLIRSKSVSYNREMDLVSLDLCNGATSQEEKTKDSPVTDTELLLASVYVDEAKCGRCGYFGTTPRELRLYKIYNMLVLRITVYFVVWLDLSLALFEEPSVPGLALPYWATMLLEYFCLFVITIRTFHVWSFASGVKFWRDKKNLIMVVFIVLTFLDMIMYVIFKEGGIPQHAVRWTRALRPLLLINISEGRQVRRSFRNIRKTLPEIANVLVLLLLCIGLFTLLGVKLFGKRNLKDAHGEPYFSNFLDTYFNLYVLTTTANNPDVTMPAYDDDPWSILFFVVFLVICMYIFVSIFLAVVYKNYRKHLKNEVRKFVYERRRQLKQAFDVLKVWHNEKWVVTEQRWQILVKEVCPKLSAPKVALLWEVLDNDGDGYIGKKDFLKVAELLNVEVIEVKDRIHFLEQYFPRLYLSYVSVKIRQVVCHRFFIYFFDLVILANAVFIALDANEYEVVFLVLFNLEICLKFYTFGIKEFFAKFWNIFDFLIIGSATLALIIETSYRSLESSQSVLDFLMVLRVLRLVKIIGQIHRFQVIIATVMQIGPAIATYGAITFVIYYFYAILGMELFANRIKMFKYPSGDDNTTVLNETSLFCGNAKLKGSDFYTDHYCNNNFNNVLKAMKVLFDLMVVNQWHVITNGFVLVTNKYARIYFFSFHLLCVILVLNIFVAFILEAFMLEYSFSCGKVENAIEKKIEEMAVGVGMSPVTDRSAEGKTTPTDIDERYQVEDNDSHVAYGNNKSKRPFSSVQNLSLHHGLRFRLPKQQSKNAETLLQQMFEGELGEDDVGPSDVDDLDDLFDQEEEIPRAKRKLTFLDVDQQFIR